MTDDPYEHFPQNKPMPHPGAPKPDAGNRTMTTQPPVNPAPEGHRPRVCPYCNGHLRYVENRTNIDVVIEKWRCDDCHDTVLFDEPGLRQHTAAAREEG